MWYLICGFYVWAIKFGQNDLLLQILFENIRSYFNVVCLPYVYLSYGKFIFLVDFIRMYEFESVDVDADM